MGRMEIPDNGQACNMDKPMIVCSVSLIGQLIHIDDFWGFLYGIDAVAILDRSHTVRLV